MPMPQVPVAPQSGVRRFSDKEHCHDMTDERVLAQPEAGVRDLRPFWRVALAIALPIGPLLVTVARAVMPYWTSDDPTTVVAKVAAAPDMMNL